MKSECAMLRACKACLLAATLLAAGATASASAQDWTSPRKGDAATRAWERSKPETQVQAQAKPGGAKRVYTEAESNKLGAEARRQAEARQEGWDRKMKAVSGSICAGC
jgi:hypothetical protein